MGGVVVDCFPQPPEPRHRRPKPGDLLELEIEGLDPQGRGQGSARGRRVAVWAAAPGARVAARVTRRHRGGIEARLEEVLDPGPHGVPARCPYFGTCGGCSFQTLDYPAQLEELGRSVRGTLAELLSGVEVRPVVGMADPWHYRNKMDFTFASRRWVESHEPQGVDAGFALGLHVPGRYDKVLDVHSCAIHFAGADALLGTARELALELGLAPWDTRAQRGLLRHLVLRKGLRSGEILVDLVTAREAPAEVEPYAAALLERHPEVTTLVQSVNTRPAAVAVGEWQRVLYGPGVIREELAGLRFTISAGSFFQTNTLGAEELLGIVREEARLTGGEVVHDLYCGAGTLGLALAGDAREVWGFEAVPAAVADARRNAADNGFAAARFLEGDVLATLTQGVPAPDLCVLDPPRAGLHPKVVCAVLRLAPPRLLLVSCSLRAALRDLRHLLAGGYRLRRVRPVDLFPHTPHLECVFTLEHRSPAGPPAG